MAAHGTVMMGPHHKYPETVSEVHPAFIHRTPAQAKPALLRQWR